MSKKTYVLGKVDENFNIDKPFVLKWGVEHESSPINTDPNKPRPTNIYEDTAISSFSNFSDLMPLGESLGTTAPNNGGPGELADTTSL